MMKADSISLKCIFPPKSSNIPKDMAIKIGPSRSGEDASSSSTFWKVRIAIILFFIISGSIPIS